MFQKSVRHKCSACAEVFSEAELMAAQAKKTQDFLICPKCKGPQEFFSACEELECKEVATCDFRSAPGPKGYKRTCRDCHKKLTQIQQRNE